MPFSIRICLLVGLLLSPLSGLAQQGQRAAVKLDVIAPFLDGQTVAVAHLDLAKIDFQAGLDFFAKGVPADLLSPEQRAEAVAKGTEIRDKLLNAGCREAFLIVSLADIPSAEPLVVLAVAKERKPEDVASVLRSLGPGPQMEPLHGALVLGSAEVIERLKTLKAVSRPDLEKALSAAGDAPLRLAVSMAEDTRRALRENLPTLPPELGGLTGGELVDSFSSLTLAASLPPQQSLLLTIQARDARAARQLSELAASALDLLAKNDEVQRRFPPIKQVVPLLTPRVERDQLVLKFDDEQGNLTKVMDELVKPAVASARAAASRAQSANNLKQLLIAMHNYHDTFKSFPPQATRKDDKKLLSWRVHLLPYLEANELYDQFHLDEPWDSDHNKKLIEKMPRVFAGQGLTDEQVKKGLTNYLAPVGPRTVFEGAAGCRLADIVDGTSNTIAIVEASAEHAVVWTSPDDWKVDFSKPFEGLRDKATGFLTAFCDGSVHHIAEAVDWNTVRRLLQKDDGEAVGEY